LVEISIGFDVGGPSTVVVGVCNSGCQFGRDCYVDETVGELC
jgi:hypothetical protein